MQSFEQLFPVGAAFPEIGFMGMGPLASGGIVFAEYAEDINVGETKRNSEMKTTAIDARDIFLSLELFGIITSVFPNL